VLIGAGISISSSSNIESYNLKYAEKTLGATDSTDAGIIFTITSASPGAVIDGISLLDGLSNVHPNNCLISVSTNVTNTTIKNIGTSSAPLNCGTVAPTNDGILLNSGTVYNILVQRVYLQNLVRSPIRSANTNQTASFVNVWGDGDDSSFASSGNDTVSRGCRWSRDATLATSVYGTHWEDAFTGTNRGRLIIHGNEPLPLTTDQCSYALGARAGFTSAGNAALPNVGDTITWTMPYYALGHTGIAQFGYGASAADTWLPTGTNAQYFEFEYQIDHNTGSFSAWKWLLSTVRRSSGGTSGTNTVTIDSTEQAALTRKPAVGDYVQTANGYLPAGTTVTNVSGAVITTSNNFTVNISANEFVYFWKDIAAETISPTTGYKLKVRLRTTIANSGNLFGQLRIPFDTNSTAQQTQYPLPGSLLTVDGLVAGSRVKVSRVDTGAFLAQAQAVGGTASFDVPYNGIVQVEARNASSLLTYKPWQSVLTISSSSPVTIVALQEVD
jgi:hypothetical protein